MKSTNVMKSVSIFCVIAAVAAWLVLGPAGNAQLDASPRETPPSLRLYVLDGGVLASDPGRYNLAADEVASATLAVAAYLIVHPRGVMLWETGAIAENERITAGTGVVQTIVRSDQQERHVTLGPPLLAQLAEVGYAPTDITHLSLSHFHWDHTANANAFAHAEWLVRPVERSAMFSDPPGSARTLTYDALLNSRTTLVTADEHDVFGDGAVILKAAPGHTPGHQVLYVNLPQTGAVVLSGDLYHYPEERTLDRFPNFEADAQQTRAARQELEAFLSRMDAELWIQHDLTAHAALKKAPEYYD